MRGGKSRFGCAEMLQDCIDYAGNRVAIIRRHRTVLKRTTLTTFLAICPPGMIVKRNMTDLEFTLWNGSQILFIPADVSRDPELNDLRSLEVSSWFIDEASEVPEWVFRMLVTRMDQWTLPDGSRPISRGIVASNPEPGWIEERFVRNATKIGPGQYRSANENHSYTQFLTRDNPYLSAEYIPELKRILTPLEQQKYLEGKFVHADEPNQLIKYLWIKDCIPTEAIPKAGIIRAGKQSLGIDVARFGDDKTVFARSYDDVLAELKEFENQSIYQTSEAAKIEINDHSIDADRVVVDTVGLGAGVYDNLHASGYNVLEFVGGAKPTRKKGHFTFKNLRSQGYWLLRELIRTGEFELMDHTGLTEDLTSLRYTIKGDREIEVESKDQIKKRIGRSPDYSDAVMESKAVEHLDAGKAEIAVV